MLCFWHLHAILVGEIACGVSATVSWVFRGTAQTNNTVLVFNQDDALNLACVYTNLAASQGKVVAITRGSKPPTAMNRVVGALGYTSTDVTNPGTLIYSDFLGRRPGFENFFFLFSGIGKTSGYYMYASVLRTSDAGTYHCSAYTYNLVTTSIASMFTSGGLNIVVNTKPGQSRSDRIHSSKFLSYSVALMGASKVLYWTSESSVPISALTFIF